MKKLNNDIKEAYCSYELGMLLRSKGFDCPCKTHFEKSLTSKKNKQDGHYGPFGWKKGELNIKSDYNTNTSLNNYYNTGKNWAACSRPTLTVCVEWINVNFGIWIYPRMYTTTKGFKFGVTAVSGFKEGKEYHLTQDYFKTGFSNPHTAIEKALMVVLTEIIK